MDVDFLAKVIKLIHEKNTLITFHSFYDNSLKKLHRMANKAKKSGIN